MLSLLSSQTSSESSMCHTSSADHDSESRRRGLLCDVCMCDRHDNAATIIVRALMGVWYCYGQWLDQVPLHDYMHLLHVPPTRPHGPPTAPPSAEATRGYIPGEGKG